MTPEAVRHARPKSTETLLGEFEEFINRRAHLYVAAPILTREESRAGKVSLQAVSPWYWDWHNNPIKESGGVTLEYKCQALGDKAFRLWMIVRVLKGTIVAEKEAVVRLEDIGTLSLHRHTDSVATLALSLRNSVVLKGMEVTNERNPTRHEIAVLRHVDVHFSDAADATGALNALRAAVDVASEPALEGAEWDGRPIEVL